ncbi:hypothetical protein HY642_02300 [Candidatus Woesearchaeota archaeon]|nr:hypothetical protein [Candidatus Woesearchaeota archaeon]
MNDNVVKIRAAAVDVVALARERAKRCKVDVSTWVYGDRLYEEIFGKLKT